MAQTTVLIFIVLSLVSVFSLPQHFHPEMIPPQKPLVFNSLFIPFPNFTRPPTEPTTTTAPTTTRTPMPKIISSCTPLFSHGAKKAIFLFYDSKNNSDKIYQMQPAIWRETKEYFKDFETISFIEVDVANCPEVLVDYNKTNLPSYGMLSDDVLLALCNAPNTFEKVWNFFFDFAYKQYKRQKNFTVATTDQCDITYPEKLGTEVFDYNHDEIVSKGHCFVLYHEPRCRYCKQFIGYWNYVVRLHSHQICMVHFDCSVSRAFCESKKVRGWPTLFFYIHGKVPVEYFGNENATELSNFIIEKMNTPIEALSTTLPTNP
ncbi:hypothetical protein PVAND_001634 [Polypedilum vanderplanki]|uniref:Thioredoxin domain-containing protein n=1 Tax=Polypedilum vanderplanki TaxID=319348 RepID=A0A9J6BPU0_POLVA|nr:hypothetical protein PVAND_001634 [Polypedilum vanderplanki]